MQAKCAFFGRLVRSRGQLRTTRQDERPISIVQEEDGVAESNGAVVRLATRGEENSNEKGHIQGKDIHAENHLKPTALHLPKPSTQVVIGEDKRNHVAHTKVRREGAPLNEKLLLPIPRTLSAFFFVEKIMILKYNSVTFLPSARVFTSVNNYSARLGLIRYALWEQKESQTTVFSVTYQQRNFHDSTGILIAIAHP